MLRKLSIVEVIPAVLPVEGQEASSTCFPRVEPDPDAPPTTPPPGGSGGGAGVSPPPGTAILLEHRDGSGGYTSEASVAPAPIGYVCRLQPTFVSVPGSSSPATLYQIVCTEP